MRCFAALAFIAIATSGCQPLSSVANLENAAGQRPAGNSASLDAPDDYVRLFNTSQHGFRFSTQGEPVRRGLISERFELRSGECQESDCGNPRYRSEIRRENDHLRMRLNRDNWIGWSFYNENISSYPRNIALKTVFGQWKLEGDLPAAIRILQLGRGEADMQGCDPAVCSGANDAGKDVVLHLDDVARAKGWGPEQNDGHVCRLFSMTQARGTWTDIVLNTNFADNQDGYIRVWVNGEQVCNYSGAVLATKAGFGARPSHRRGIFVSYSERWDTQRPNTDKPTMVVYYDEFLTGRSREEVDTRLREVSGLPAVD